MLNTIPSDERIVNLSNLEMYWIAMMMEKDQIDDFERRRMELEYLASFINPEAVARVRDARENSFKVSDEDFASIIESFSGEKLPELTK